MRKWIYDQGVKLWNDKVYGKLDFLLESQYWDREKIGNMQLDLLRNITSIAYENTPFYRNKYKSSGFHPNDIKGIADINNIPIVTKEELLSNRDDIQIRNGKDKLYFAETSGSTGKPLVFYRDQDWDAWNRSSMFRGYRWHDVNPWERNGYLWGYNFSLKKRIKVKLYDELQNRFRLFSYKNNEIDRFLGNLEKAVYIGGYSSMIYELAKSINRRNCQDRYKIKMVKGTSEKIYDSYQEEVIRAFGKRMISEYGAAETGLIAFECPKGKMHINMETVIVEEVQNEIVITNLISRSFPVIRYKLGDYIELETGSECACGRKHPIVKEVLGRTGKVIYGNKDRYPSLTLYYVFKNIAIGKKLILNYVAVQKEKGVIELNIEQKLSDSHRKWLMVEYDKYFQDDLRLILKDGADLKRENAKKTDFISYL